MLGKWTAMRLSGAVLKHVLWSQLTEETTSTANGPMEAGATVSFASKILTFFQPQKPLISQLMLYPRLGLTTTVILKSWDSLLPSSLT